ncbi:MAG: VTT domain-containing protein [Xanthomonadales bacterium]|nr:VTT domain-containing protein [Xanthomonadales bacterium]MDH3923618.1 VTT domain-containing protein [Xanthomonadales bacterium]MDH3939575.1 VTT domain-containing protein [Xanthomonadales bacterium]MDH3999733.1 VTT domain-containing protein [Xanthomonadales bacterium]
MDTSWTQELLSWLNAHPGWGFAIVFLVALFESLVLVGILLPGIVILFGVGTLIGLGILELLPIWLAATTGAFIGDFLSYLLGHRFKAHLLDIWPFSRYPALMERGTRFFHAHGAKSVVAGRFIGPLRPIIPAVAGMMGMKPGRFIAVDVPACITWAPSFLLPGLLFGASLEVASEYTGRLTVMLVILVVILWMTWWLIRLVYEPLATRSARWMRHGIRWSRRHPVLGRVAGPVLDPTRGETLSVTMMGVLLVFVFWGLLMLLFLSPFSSQPETLDQAVMNLALALRNHLADPVMVSISQLSRWPVSVFSAVALLLWLLGAGRRNAAKHWVIAIGGGALLHLLLSWSLRTTPQVLEMTVPALQGPSAAMSLPTVVLMFFAIMEAGELPRKHRQWPYLVAALLLILLALARLYLGMEWLSGALMGLVSGLAWTAIVGIAYRQRADRRFSGATASLIFYGSFLALFSWQVNEHLAEDLVVLKSPTVLQDMDLQAWWESEWRELPMERTKLSSVASRRFNAQVAVDPEELSGLLQQSGWEPVPDTDWRWIIQALNPKPDQASLPLLGRAFQGRSEALMLQKNLETEGRLLTIRLWDSGFRLLPGQQVLYLGQLSEEVLVQRLGLFSYWRSSPVGPHRFAPLREPLSELQQKRVDDRLLLIRSVQAD